MASSRKDAKKHANTRRRHRLNPQERHQRHQRQAQHHLDALRQALSDLGVAERLAIEIEDRLRAQKTLLSTIFGLTFPPSLGAEAPMNCFVYADGTTMCPPYPGILIRSLYYGAAWEKVYPAVDVTL